MVGRGNRAPLDNIWPGDEGERETHFVNETLISLYILHGTKGPKNVPYHIWGLAFFIVSRNTICCRFCYEINTE